METTQMQKIKQKRTSITFQQRLEILDRLEAGESATKLASEFGVCVSTISHIKRNKTEFLEKKRILESCDGNFEQKKLKNKENTPLEKAVYNWMCDVRHTGAPITGPVLQQVALNYNSTIQGSSQFKASSGWLRNFRSRHDIKWKSIQGEKLSANTDASENFKCKFAGFMELTENRNLDCIYNCDETGLYWKLLPNKTFVKKNEKEVSGWKKAKSRITVMNCTNASGSHKIPLLLIGKSKKPRCYEQMKRYPIHYSHQNSAWMDSEIMKDWFLTCFIPEVKKFHNYESNKNLKILLLMDNAPCHLSTAIFHEMCDFCTVIFLPPNTTSLLQPMDQGIIEKFKRCYRNALLSDLLIEKSTEGFEKAYNSLQLSDCFRFCTQAWNEITQDNIRKCWKPLIPMENNGTCDTYVEVPNSSELQILISSIPELCDINIEETEEWINADKHEPCWERPSNDELLGECSLAANEVLAESEMTSEEEEPVIEKHTDITLKNIYDALKMIMDWSLTSDDPTFAGLFVELENWRQIMSKKLLEKQK